MQFSQAPSSTRLVAVLSGVLGLITMTALTLAVTPRHGAPEVVGATSSSPARSPQFIAGTSPASASASPPPDLEQRWLATAIGDGTLAVMARRQGVPAAEFDVELTSGPVVTAVVATVADDIVVLAIDGPAAGHTVATHTPLDGELVTVLVEPPVTVAITEVAALEPVEGTPVLDHEGKLVGLCTQRGASATTVLDVVAPLQRLFGRSRTSGRGQRSSYCRSRDQHLGRRAGRMTPPLNADTL